MKITSLTELASHLAVDEVHLAHVAAGAARAYRERRIKKKDSNKFRVLTIPDESLKSLQRRIHERFFRRLNWPPCVCGGVKGKSIANHARPHCRSRSLLVADIRDFFPSITANRVSEIFTGLGIRGEANQLLVRLVTYGNALPQGAPTSTAIANLAFLEADRAILRVASGRGLTYTRYIDDLALSGKETRDVQRAISRIIRKAGFALAPNKTRTHSPCSESCCVVNLRVDTPRPQPTQAFIDEVREEIQDYLCADAVGGRDEDWLKSIKGRVAFVAQFNRRDADILSSALMA